MITIYTGLPRNGKSYGALKMEIVDELLHGKREIRLFFPLLLPELNEYLQRVLGWAGDLGRIRLLTTEEAREFWLYRPRTGKLTKPDPADPKFVCMTDDATDGVLYVIDEAHKFWDARNWVSTGDGLTHYNSQHGKLNDRVVFITQFVDLLDKRCRVFAQNFVYFDNGVMRRYFTLFRGPSYITARTYGRQQKGLKWEMPEEVYRFRLDLRLASCYDTSAGVGIAGRRKPEERRRKGLPLWLLAIPGIGAIYVVAKVPDWGAKALTAGILAGARPSRGATSSAAPLRPNGAIAPQVPSRTSPAGVLDRPAPPGPVYGQDARGVVWSGGRCVVVLADGSRLIEGEIVRIERTYVADRWGVRHSIRSAAQDRFKEALRVSAVASAVDSPPGGAPARNEPVAPLAEGNLVNTALTPQK